MRNSATILHADLDAFYASVEQLLNPQLRGRPIAVGGGVVLAASYEARVFGVKGGMSGRLAKRLCPTLQFVDGHFREYQEFGDRVIATFYDVTPLVERISIDEAFLDVAGAIKLFGEPTEIAKRLRERVRTEIGLPLSIGVATTKHLAKVASQVAKPNGLVVVEAGTEQAFLEPLPIGLVWGIGPVTEKRLHARGITTIGELSRSSPDHLRSLLGSAASEVLVARASNVDERRVAPRRRASSVGAQSACGRQRPTDEFLRSTLGHLADRVARRLRGANRAGRTVTVRVRFSDLRAVTRSQTVSEPLSATLTINEIAEGLVRLALADHPQEAMVSLIAVSISGLVDDAAIQMELPFSDASHEANADAVRAGSARANNRRAVDDTMDDVRAKFGKGAVSYLSASRSQSSGVADEFRELAERDV